MRAHHANIRLEGPNKSISEEHLEPKDLVAHPSSSSSSMLDGLYHYSSKVRTEAVNYLHDLVENKAFAKSGPIGKFLADAPDDLADQICNAFAFDWTDGDSKNSNKWENPEEGNAVSPSDMMLWDGQDTLTNKNGFSSVYGFVENAHYEMGETEFVNIWKWNHVETRGNIDGIVIADFDVIATKVELKGSNVSTEVETSEKDAESGQFRGQFRFKDIFSGKYQIYAGKDHEGMWYSNLVDIEVTVGTTQENIELHLQPPPGIVRLVKIHFDIISLERYSFAGYWIGKFWHKR